MQADWMLPLQFAQPVKLVSGRRGSADADAGHIRRVGEGDLRPRAGDGEALVEHEIGGGQRTETAGDREAAAAQGLRLHPTGGGDVQGETPPALACSCHLAFTIDTGGGQE